MNFEELDELIKNQEAEIEKIEADNKALEEAYNNKEIKEEEYQKYKTQNEEFIKDAKKKISNLKGRKTKAVNKKERDDRAEEIVNNYLIEKKEKLDNVLIGLDQELLDKIEETKKDRKALEENGLDNIDSSNNIDIELLERIVNEHNQEDIDKVLAEIDNGNVTGIERLRFEKILNKINKTLPEIKNIEENINTEEKTDNYVFNEDGVVIEDTAANVEEPVVEENNDEYSFNEEGIVTEDNSLLKQQALEEQQRENELREEITNLQTEIKDSPSITEMTKEEIDEYDNKNKEINEKQQQLNELESKNVELENTEANIVDEVASEVVEEVHESEVERLNREIDEINNQIKDRDRRKFIYGDKAVENIDVDALLKARSEKQEELNKIMNGETIEQQEEIVEDLELKGKIDKYKNNLETIDTIMNGKELSDPTPEQRNYIAMIVQAKKIFELDRNIYETEDDHNEEEWNQIVENNNDIEKILNDTRVDLSNPKQAYNWLRRLTPYLNIHSTTANLKTPLDEYVLTKLKDNNYSTEESKIVDENSFFDNIVALKMQELEKYHFIPSEYPQVHNANIELTSSMVKDIAKLNYYKEIEENYVEKLNEYNDRIKDLNTDREDLLSEYQDHLDILNKENTKGYNESLETNLNVDNGLNLKSVTYVTEANDANQAYDNFKNMPTVENAKKMFEYIGRLHDPSLRREAKDKAYRLYAKVGFNEKQKSDISEYTKSLGIRLDKLKEKAEFDDKEIADRKEKIEAARKELTQVKDSELATIDEELKKENAGREKINATLDSVRAKMKPLRESLYEKGYIEPVEPIVEVEKPRKEKTNFFTKIKNFFTKQKEVDFDLTPVSEEEEDLEEFVPIRKISEIKETLYEKIKSIKFKEVLNKALEYMKKNYKAAVVIGLATLGIIVGANGLAKQAKASTDTKDDDTRIEQESSVEPEEVVEIALEESGATIDEEDVEELTETRTEEIMQKSQDQSIIDALSGETQVYTSVDRAAKEIDGYASDQLVLSSWENAERGTMYHYNQETGTIKELTNEEAMELFEQGNKDLVQSVVNTMGTEDPSDDVIIGFTNVEPEEGRSI